MTPAKPQAQPVNSSSPVNYDAVDAWKNAYWDAADGWAYACEQRRREEWVMLTEQAERNAMFTAEFCGGPSLMERAAGPLLFLLAAFVAAGVIVAVGKATGWVQ